MPPSDEPVDGEFIDATPVKPTAWKCHCPACRVMIGAGNFCDDCMRRCVPDLRRNHSGGPRSAPSVVDGLKAGVQLVEGLATIAGVVRGRPGRRRRLR